MNLYDEEQDRKDKRHTSKTKKIIIASIILLIFLIGIITILIFYMMNNPLKITAYVDGVQKNELVDLLDFQTDENGKTQIYIPIKDVATYFGYTGYKGEYGRASEDSSKCYVISQGYEVAMYTAQSNLIYKLNLQENKGEYDYCNADKAVFESNGKLYTSVDGAEQGFNIIFKYDEKNKKINIYTLPFLANSHQSNLQKKQIGSYGTVQVDEKLSNWKAIFDEMLIVKAQNGKYGVISAADYSIILEPKYDNVSYVQCSTDFLIKTNGKVGLMSKDGETKINALYDELTLMDRNAKLYKIKTGNTYGIIDEDEDTIIYPEYEKIGIDIESFSANGIRSGYIILNKLIPVMQNSKWAFFDLKGNMITHGFIYDTIGCKASSANNVYSILEVPNYNVIVVGQNNKYAFMDINGNDNVLPYGFIFEEVFMRVSSGQTSYWMKYNKKEWNVIEYLERQGLKPIS